MYDILTGLLNFQPLNKKPETRTFESEVLLKGRGVQTQCRQTDQKRPGPRRAIFRKFPG